MRTQLDNQPSLTKHLIPNFNLGCKRVLLSHLELTLTAKRNNMEYEQMVNKRIRVERKMRKEKKNFKETVCFNGCFG